MTQNIAKYGISLEFDNALKSLKKFKTEANKINKMQTAMNSQRRTAKKAMLKQESTDLKSYYKDLENQADKAYRADQKRLSQRRQQSTMGAVKSLTSPSGASGMRDHYSKLEVESAKSYKKQLDKRSSLENNYRRQQAVSNITAPSGAESMRSFYKDLEKDAKSLRREQEKLGTAMNRDVNQNIKLQKRRAKELERAKEALFLTALMQDKSNNLAVKSVQNSIKARVNQAKTAKEVKLIVARERARLKLMKKQSFFSERMASSSKQYIGNMIGAFAIAAGGTYITKTGQDFQSAVNTLTALTGSAEKAGQEMQYLKEFTYEMGLPLKETSKDYAKLMAAVGDKLPVEQAKTLFEDLGKASVVMGTSAEDSSGIFKALGQMLSKGKIQAEEYRGQLGDRMPIALEAMTKAAVKAGVVTDDMIKKFGSASGAMEKLMEDGKLYSKDILPYFGAEIRKKVDKGLDAALSSNRAAMGRLQNATENAANTIFKSGWMDGLTELFQALADMLIKNEVLLISFGKIAGKVFSSIAWVVKNILAPALSALGSIMNGLIDIFGETGVVLGGTVFALWRVVKALKAVTGAMTMFGLAANLSLLPIIGTVAAIAAGLMLLEELFEVISPTGKQSVVRKVLGLKEGEGVYSKKNISDKALSNPNIKSLNYGMPISDAQSKPSYSYVTVELDGEVVGRAAAKSEAMNSKIASGNYSSNY